MESFIRCLQNDHVKKCYYTRKGEFLEMNTFTPLVGYHVREFANTPGRLECKIIAELRDTTNQTFAFECLYKKIQHDNLS